MERSDNQTPLTERERERERDKETEKLQLVDHYAAFVWVQEGK